MGQNDALGLPPGLREDYLQSARDRLGEIAELAERLVAAPADPAALDELRGAAHKIRGSAGSFGFAQASAVAAELEETVRKWLADPALAAGERGVAARGFVRRLAAALFTRQTEPVPDVAPPAEADVLPDLPMDLTPVPEVIIVEADLVLAERLTFGLETRGFRFVHYRTGGEAITALRALDPRGASPLVIVDWDLPASAGAGVVEALEREAPGKYRFVVATAKPGDATRRWDCLLKPMNLHAALEKIATWTGR